MPLIYLMMEKAKSLDKALLLGFMNDQKAFDFTNRYELIKSWMTKGAGKRFTNAIKNIYKETYYIPKTKVDRLGVPIKTRDGVPQGRKTSANLFSFYLSDMPISISVKASFLQDICTLQLADATAFIAVTTCELRKAFSQAITHSKNKYMSTNLSKTYYLHLEDILPSLGRHITFTWKTYYLHLEDILPSLGRHITFTWKTYYLHLEDILPSLGRYITSTWKTYYFHLEDILLSLGRHITFTWKIY